MSAVDARSWERAGAVIVAGLALVIASQVIASVDPSYEQRRGEDEETEVAVGAPEASTTTSSAAGPVSTTTTTEALPPITGPVRLDERSGLDGRGIGPVEAGMTVAEAEQAAGRRFAIVDRADPTDTCYGATPDGLVGLRFAVQGPAGDPREGRIVRVEALDSGWATVSGARVGQSVAEVRRAYGRRVTGDEKQGLLTVPVKDGGRSFAVGFVTSDRGVVTQMRSGDAAAVAQPAGCT